MATPTTDPQSQQNTTPFQEGTNPLMNLLMGSNPFMGMGQPDQPAVAPNRQEGVAGGSSELKEILKFLTPGATRLDQGGQREGEPAPDPFTRLNAQRESQQSHELDKFNQQLAMQQGELAMQQGELDWQKGAQELAAFILPPAQQQQAANPITDINTLVNEIDAWTNANTPASNAATQPTRERPIWERMYSSAPGFFSGLGK